MSDSKKQENKSAIITPWEVKGNIDYDKLITEFGTEKIDQKLLDRIEKHAKKKGMSLHPFLKRNIFFSHRDMNWILDKYEKGEKFFLYTGRSPSSHTHLGHMIPWMFTKWLQDVFDVELYFQFPDEEKFLAKKNLDYDTVQHYLEENMLDVIALGFDPKKTHFLIDTKHANLTYKYACQIAKKITFSAAKSTFGFENDTNIGFIFYTAMQSVPAMLPSALAKKNVPCLIPYAIDQDAHFRLTRDVLPKLGYYKPAAIHCRFLPGLGGMQDDGKMSSSNENATIYTTDTLKVVEKKVKKHAFSGGGATLEEHKENGGNPDIDVAYLWLTFLEEDDQKLKALYDGYKAGTILSGEMKQALLDVLLPLWEKHHKARENAKGKVDQYLFKHNDE